MTDASLDKFRTETRAWLEANCPPSMRTPMTADEEATWGGKKFVFKNPEAKLWLDRMAERGWTAPTWPREYGGGGLNPAENAVLQAELRRINARPALDADNNLLRFDLRTVTATVVASEVLTFQVAQGGRYLLWQHLGAPTDANHIESAVILQDRDSPIAALK